MRLVAEYVQAFTMNFGSEFRNEFWRVIFQELLGSVYLSSLIFVQLQCFLSKARAMMLGWPSEEHVTQYRMHRIEPFGQRLLTFYTVLALIYGE